VADDVPERGPAASPAPLVVPPSPALAPYDPPRPPERPSGDGPVELWRRANAATRGTVVGVLLVLLVGGSFLAGRLTAPAERSAGGGGDPAAAEVTASPERVEAATQQDDAAKTVARDLVTFVESCAAANVDPDYSQCRTKAQLNVGSTLPLVDGRQATAGEAAVTATRSGYRIVSVSASGNAFVLAKDGAAGQSARTCTDTGVQNAGCVGGAW
jgi:hypothetical protein